MPGAPHISKSPGDNPSSESLYTSLPVVFLTSFGLSANLSYYARLSWFVVFLKHRVLLIQVSRRPVGYAFERVVRLRT